jgi:hypothetical protein
MDEDKNKNFIMSFAQHSRKNKGDSKASPYGIISHSTPQAQVYNFACSQNNTYVHYSLPNNI